jgi:alpha-amylase/alpha-mannosidase (GH57 family)
VLNVALIWHMHQPDYRDPLTGRFILPWVRLHAVKDYLDLVDLGRGYPTIHQTFNLVPTLMDQLDAYGAGAIDRHMELALQTPDRWQGSVRGEMVERFFDLSWQRMLDPFPRLRELADKRQRLRDEGLEWEAVGDRFTDAELVDLTVLYHLAWTDPCWRGSDPVLAGLSARGRDFTTADSHLLIERHLDLVRRTIPAYAEALASGRVELTVTPYAHPILPLLIDSDVARIAMPDAPLPNPAFRYPEDAAEHVAIAMAAFQRRFGQRPHGMWPSEQSVSPATMALLSQAQLEWTISDEAVLGRTLGIDWRRDERGVPDQADVLYRPYQWADGPAIVFRDHTISDLIGFTYSTWGALAAARDLYGRLKAIEARLDCHDGVPPLVTIALDGENCWEFYPEDGDPFLRALFDLVAADASLRFVTVHEHLALGGHRPQLTHIHSGSWIDADFGTWIGEPTKNRAWQELTAARSLVAGSTDVPEGVREHLRIAEGSDWFWWYGDGHSSANDAQFDMLFRHRLQAVYLGLGLPVPERLQHSLYDEARLPEELARQGWLWSASQDLGGSRGTMHAADTVAGRLTWGGDGAAAEGGAWRLRWQPARSYTAESGDEVVVVFDPSGCGHGQTVPPLDVRGHARLIVSPLTGAARWSKVVGDAWTPETLITGQASAGGWDWRLPGLDHTEITAHVRIRRHGDSLGTPPDPLTLRWHE